MPSTPIPELEPKQKPEPEMKKPRKPEPEVKLPPTPAKPEVGDDQGDSGPDKGNPITQKSRAGATRSRPDPGNAHIGATEDQVSDTAAPAGDAYKDEPRQG